ncbi:hypothetical protein [Methylocapsa acidiphila]|uniref:hypothetical protein n=1 Tax=Methylocapsa acidiphila TaxID=133552 RepID=UPI000429CBDC|nr:hypothetical protein [Methylocapsa acidiphila]
MYFSLGQAAKEAGVAKSTISKALSSGKLSYTEKGTAGYKIDPAELFRVFPKTSKPEPDELSLDDWKPSKGQMETSPYSAAFEIQLAGLKHLLAEKDRRISDLEQDRAQLREDRGRMSQNWQEERLRLLKLIEDQTSAVKLLTDQRAKSEIEVEAQKTFWRRLFGSKRSKLDKAA